MCCVSLLTGRARSVATATQKAAPLCYCTMLGAGLEHCEEHPHTTIDYDYSLFLDIILLLLHWSDLINQTLSSVLVFTKNRNSQSGVKTCLTLSRNIPVQTSPIMIKRLWSSGHGGVCSNIIFSMISRSSTFIIAGPEDWKLESQLTDNIWGVKKMPLKTIEVLGKVFIASSTILAPIEVALY